MTSSEVLDRQDPMKKRYVGYLKPRCGMNSKSHSWLLDKYFILSKGNFIQNKRITNLTMGYENLSNGYHPIRTRQISLGYNDTL